VTPRRIYCRKTFSQEISTDLDVSRAISVQCLDNSSPAHRAFVKTRVRLKHSPAPADRSGDDAGAIKDLRGRAPQMPQALVKLAHPQRLG
jgi:hypothetical protein